MSADKIPDCEMTEAMAERIANYLIMHKWLAAAPSEGLVALLVKAIIEGAKEES